MLLGNKARVLACNNRLFVVDMAGVEQGNISNEEFMEEVARYECVYHRNSKDFKDKNKKAKCWKEISLRSKRFRGVREQRKSEKRDFRSFARAKNGAYLTFHA